MLWRSRTTLRRAQLPFAPLVSPFCCEPTLDEVDAKTDDCPCWLLRQSSEIRQEAQAHQFRTFVRTCISLPESRLACLALLDHPIYVFGIHKLPCITWQSQRRQRRVQPPQGSDLRGRSSGGVSKSPPAVVGPDCGLVCVDFARWMTSP